MLTTEGCRRRQERLLEAMREEGLDAVFLSNYKHVYYLTGLLEPRLPVGALVRSEGEVWLLAPETGAETVADRFWAYPRSAMDRVQNHAAEAAALLAAAFGRPDPSVGMIGIEPASVSETLLEPVVGNFTQAEWRDVSALLALLRKTKDDDELALIRRGVVLCEAGYEAARAAIEPGKSECDIFTAVYGAIVQEAGTSVPFAGDFGCGTRAAQGGPPTRRVLGAGELFILDLFPTLDGYWADLCRTFAVTEPDAVQQAAWGKVRDALALAESLIKAGLPGSDLWREVRTFLDGFEAARGSFTHHAGHGIGLDPHEAPRLIPGSGHVFEVGDVFTLEPALYGEALQGGVRLEQLYVLRASGLDRLSKFPLDL